MAETNKSLQGVNRKIIMRLLIYLLNEKFFQGQWRKILTLHNQAVREEYEKLDFVCMSDLWSERNQCERKWWQFEREKLYDDANIFKGVKNKAEDLIVFKNLMAFPSPHSPAIV